MWGINRLVTTLGGIGYLSHAPGTFAAAFATIVWYLCSNNFAEFHNWQIILVAISIIAGVYFSDKVCLESGKDPSFIVIDELAGMWVALLLIPPSLVNYILAFALFRFFDIVKPLGIRSLEKVKNGWGVMLDDILAGIYSNITLRFLIFLKLW